jgi:protocatechuate 3,4-dioxygenase beta subunit
MTSTSTQSGRALPLVLVLVAVAVIGLLVVADPLGLFGASDVGDGEAGGPPDLLAAETDAADEPASESLGGGGLAGRYGEGDMGAIKARLIRVGTRQPLAGQSVELLDRRGQIVTPLPSDANGVIWFTQVLPAKGYQLHMKGEGFSEFTLQGISVFPQATTDVGDIVLGKDIVLRGRVVDGSGRPVPGTSVSVHTIERELATKGMLVFLAEQAGSVPMALSAVESDNEGYFAFSALDDGTYSLVARHGGYASKHEADVLVARERGAGVLTITLGQAGRMSGKVIGHDGKPVVGAQVIAIRDVRRMTSNPLQREVALTDAKGEYTIDTLTADQRYRFGVVAKGYAPMYEVSGVQITAQGQEKDFLLVKGGNLTGVVTDEATGKPIDGARIAVYVGQMGWGGNRDPNAKAAADLRRTDDKGRFLFEALSPGPVSSAVVQAPGYVTASFSMWPPPGNQWPDVKAEETTEVEVALKRGGSIKGRVLASEGSEPIQGAEVMLMQTGWAAMASMWLGTPNAITGADGSYELTGVTPGKYRLMALAEGFTPAGGEQGVEVEVAPSGGTVERDLQLISAGIVAGIVVDNMGEPVAGVKIRLRAGPGQANEGGRRGGGRGMNMARQALMGGRSPVDLSDEDGKFRLTGVGSDTMWVAYGESDEYVSGETKPFKLAAGETKDVELQMLPGGAIRGTVVDENGRRMAGVRVQVGRLPDELAGKVRISSWEARRALGSKAYTTDEEGRFFAPNLKPGRTLVRASKDSYITFYKRNATVRPGETIENYTIALSRGEVLEGTVRGADGAPLRRATISVTTDPNPGSDEEEDTGEASEDVEPAMWARTDDSGKFKIENIKPGSYNVVVWFAPGHKGWMRENSPAAMHRDVSIPGSSQEFRLEKSDPQAAPAMPGRGGR